MPFGNPITEGTEQLQSATGAVVAFDLANQNPERLTQVVVYDDETADVEVLTSGMGVDQLFLMPFSASAPPAAYAQQGNIVYVFVQDAVFALDIHSRIAFWMQAHAPIMTSLDGTLSIPAAARQLLAALVDEGEGEGKPDFFQAEGVRRERSEIGV